MITDEQAKAAGEIAKAGNTGLELAGKAASFVAKVFGDTAAQLGGMATDQVKLWRYKQLLLIKDRVDAIHQERGIEGKTIPVPYKLGLPMLEAASLEDDEILQQLWAKLISNAMDPQYSDRIHPSFVDVAKQLSSDEALMLIKIAEQEALQEKKEEKEKKKEKEERKNESAGQKKEREWEARKEKELDEKMHGWRLRGDATNDVRSDVPDAACYMPLALHQFVRWTRDIPVRKESDITLYYQNLIRLQILDYLERAEFIGDVIHLGHFGREFINACIR